MTPEDVGQSLATDVRAERNLGLAGIADVADLLESYNIDVMFVPMPEGVYGLTRRNADEGDTLVAVAIGRSYERQRFTLAHELGHVLVGDLESDTTDIHAGARETRAHAFARNLLAPLDGVNALGPSANQWHRVSDVVRHFGVSPKVATIQLQRLGEFDEPTGRALGEYSAGWYAERFGWAAAHTSNSEASNRPRPPRRIASAGTEAYAAGRLDAATVSRLTFRRLEDHPDVDVVVPEPALERDPFAVGDDDW